MSTVITSIDPHSPAEKAGIVVGEQLLEINGHHIVDVLDYRFYGYDPVAVLRLSKDGHTRTVTIRKEEGRDLGLNFNTYLMDEMHQCANHCLFCFVDQMPPNMRPSLYIKDDDERLSFLLGNYTTLTNLSEREAQPSTPRSRSSTVCCWATRERSGRWNTSGASVRRASS